MRRLLLLSAVIPLVFAVIACGGASSDGPHSFLGKAQNAAIYVSWNRAGDTITGQLTQALRDDTDNKVNTSRVSFDGTVKASGVTLQLGQGFGSVSTLTGELAGDRLELEYPGSEGGNIVTVRFKPATSTDYNQALAQLQGQAADARAAAQQAADDATAREQQAADDATARDDASRLAQRVGDDLNAVASASAAESASTYAQDLATLRQDAQTVQQDLQTVQSDAAGTDRDLACSDAETASSDVDTLRSDIDTLRNDAQTAITDATRSDAIKTLRDDYATLQTLAPELQPTDGPTLDQVQVAVAQAHKTVRQVKAASNDAMAQANGILGEAKSYEAQAQAICSRVGA
jgi:hypothetical protein